MALIAAVKGVAAAPYQSVIEDDREDPVERLHGLLEDIAAERRPCAELSEAVALLMRWWPLEVEHRAINAIEAMVRHLTSSVSSCTNAKAVGPAPLEALLRLLNQLINLKKVSLERNSRVQIAASLTQLQQLKYAALGRLAKTPQLERPVLIQLWASFLNLGEGEAYMDFMSGYVARKWSERDSEAQGATELIDLDRLNPSIGILALVDYVLRAKKLGLLEERSLVVLSTRAAANTYLLELLGRYVPIVRDEGEAAVLRALPGALDSDLSNVVWIAGRWMFWGEAMALVYRAWAEKQSSPLLALPLTDIDRGQSRLQAMGIGPEEWFACLHVRQGSFKGRFKLDSPHDCEIGTYHRAIEVITAQGGWVVRLGDPSMPPLEDLPRVIDYAHSEHKSPFMDIFLISQCRFIIGTSSGPSVVAHAFDRPTVMTNLQPLIARPPHDFDIFIPKLYREVQTGRLLPFSEVLGSALGYAFNNGQFYVDAGIEVVDNGSEEVADAVVEMMDRLEVGEAPSAGSPLQEQFDALCCGPFSYGTESRLAQSFAERHQSLL